MRAAVVAVAAGLVVLAAACGGGHANATHESGAVAFSSCMRSNGVPSFPDPDGSGATPKESLGQLGVSASRFQSAQSACRHLLPNGGRAADQAQRQQVRELGLRFAECVRAHGVPSFPDPGSDGRIPDPATLGIDQGSPRFRAANDACGRYRPPYMPSNSAYDRYARTATN